MASSSQTNFDAESNSSETKCVLKGRNYPCFIDLMKNNRDTFLATSNILLRFANNILKAPDNLRYRNIRLGNEIFMTKLLPVGGAVDCLFSMGFKEVDDKLFLDPACPLDDLKVIRDALLDETDKRTRLKSSNIEQCHEDVQDVHGNLDEEANAVSTCIQVSIDTSDADVCNVDKQLNDSNVEEANDVNTCNDKVDNEPSDYSNAEEAMDDDTCNNNKVDNEISGDSNVEKADDRPTCVDILPGTSTVPTVNKDEPREEVSTSMQTFSAGKPIVFAQKELCYVPRLNTQEERTFYQKLLSQIDVVFMYENAELQDLARQCIPIEKLEQKAKKDYELKNDSNTIEPLLSEKDCFLLNLLAWFKKDFFTWTNAPNCNKCGGKTKSHSSDLPNEEERRWDCSRVECYQCFNCYIIIRFPRYNNPQKLLETRTGRCGEWANCFTLCCRAVGFEARYVLDWTDHVWTEVYSEHQHRWLHCDSCENACDKPLLYEQGWSKKLSYVVSLSKDEVVDVTWRYTARDKDSHYTSLHKDVLTRRGLVTEQWLLNFSAKSTEELQRNIIDDERKSILSKRRIVEIVESLSPKSTSKKEEEGRVSGSLEWRKTRGEVGSKRKCHLFQGSEETVKNKKMRIRYFPARDCYSTSLEDTPLDDTNIIHGWENGVESSENMFRKVEDDWKMIYLARREGTASGTIQWGIDVGDAGLVISLVNVKIQSMLYESGEIDFKLFSELKSVDLKDGVNISPDAFAGSKTLRLSACLNGSSGDVAWQHAQLFRCAESQEDFIGLEFDVTFCN